MENIITSRVGIGNKGNVIFEQVEYRPWMLASEAVKETGAEVE